MKRAASSEVVVENSHTPSYLMGKTSDSKVQQEQWEPLLALGIFFCWDCLTEYQDNHSFQAHNCANDRLSLQGTSEKAAASYSDGQEQSSSDESSSDGQEQSSSDESSSSSEWRCNFCNTTSSSYHTIWRHQLAHVELKRYLCKLCGFRCNTIKDRWLHAGFHNKEGPMFIEDFIRTQFTVDLPFPIQEGNTTSSSLPLQMMSEAAAVAYSGGQEQSSSDESSLSSEWGCNFCNTTSSSYQTIWRHQLAHVELKRYLCKLCGFRCKTIKDKWLHADFHIKEGPMVIEDFFRTHFTVDLPLPIQECNTNSSSQPLQMMSEER